MQFIPHFFVDIASIFLENRHFQVSPYLVGCFGFFVAVSDLRRDVMCVGAGKIPQKMTVTLLFMENPHEKSRENGKFLSTLIQVLPLSVNIMKVACAYMTEKSEIQDDDDEENKRVDMKPYISRSVKPRLDYTQTDWYLDYVNIFRTSNPIFFIRWEKKFRRKFRVPHYFLSKLSNG